MLSRPTEPRPFLRCARAVGVAVVVGLALNSEPSIAKASPGPGAVAPPTGATTAAAAKPVDATARELATAAFKEGTKLVSETRWAEALASFERAEQSVPHAVTKFNIGVCERALGKYVAARRTFRLALEEHASKRSTLPTRLEQDATAYLREIDGLLVRVVVDVEPASASLAVDGRPLTTLPSEPGAAVPVVVAGLSPPGKGEPVPAKRFELEMDYGRHVLTFSRPGHTDAILAKDFAPGRAPALSLALDELPATIEVSADQPGSIVTVDGRDFGPVPVVLQRPAGSYRILVEKDGFVAAEGQLDVRAGEAANFRAKLPVDEPSIVQSWWFWTLTAGAIAGVGVGTYFLTREAPEPVRATVGDGTLGWRVPLP